MRAALAAATLVLGASGALAADTAPFYRMTQSPYIMAAASQNAAGAPFVVPFGAWVPSLSTASSIKGSAVKPLTLTILGLTITLAPSAVFNVEAWCS